MEGMAAPGAGEAARRRRILRIGIVVLALVVGLIAWLAIRDDGDSGSATGFEAKIVDPDELKGLAAASGHAVYWAGPPQAEQELEASETAAGDFRVRYLDAGAEAGSRSLRVLTIGSYPLPDPIAAVKGFAGHKGSVTRSSADGREVVTSAEKPTSVYFASSDGSAKVEVYAPEAEQAMSLALSAEVRPVG